MFGWFRIFQKIFDQEDAPQPMNKQESRETKLNKMTKMNQVSHNIKLEINALMYIFHTFMI